METYRKAVSQHEKYIVCHGLALTTIALARYRLTHDDHWPDDLQALVPSYLPMVPVDVMDGKPLRYDAKAGRLWSIGEDFLDSRGLTPDWPESVSEETPGVRVISKLEPSVDLKKFFAR